MPGSQSQCGACRDAQAAFPFTMAFQPIVDLERGCIDAHEALVRGIGGEGAGHVLGQLDPSNLYAFDQACRVRSIELAARLGLQQRLNINFLPNAVYEPKACIRLTLDAAARTGFPLDRLTFEIVESETLVERAHLLSIVTEYRRQGFCIALDDFGTGYSGMVRLAELRPDIVKLDRDLVAGCDQDATKRTIIAGMVGLCRELGTKLVVEGAERREEVEALRGIGVRFVQGFYFSRPRFEALATEAEVFGPAVALAG